MKKNNNKCEECYKNGKKPSDIDCKKCDEVIIDGCNVAECDFIVNSIPADCDIDTCFCYENPNCYYKQLQRAKAENEKLKKEVEDLNFYIDSYRQVWEIDKYRKALEEINLILCEGRTFYDGYFDTDNLSRTDKTIKLINEVLND